MDESILVNYLRGGSNDEECRQVELWCEEAPENRQILEQLYYTLFVGDRMAVMDAVDTEASLTKFKSLVREKEKKAKRRSISVRWGRYASAAAAFLAGLVFAGGIAWGLLSNKLSDYTVMTTGGQRAQTVLPDGSKVWLNASTKLIYRNSFWSTDRRLICRVKLILRWLVISMLLSLLILSILRPVCWVQSLMYGHVKKRIG